MAAFATPATASPEPIGARVLHVTAAELGTTWRSECPVAPEDLRRVQLNYMGFDGNSHRGDLVVHERAVPDAIAIFQELYDLRFPIEKMRTVDHYPNASDELSMEDNNTSAFNCREIPGTGRWSQHAVGLAIDINPRLNPHVRAGVIEPRNATPYADRQRTDPGMLHADGPVVRAFTARGWNWGGNWRSSSDYQHFELS